MNRIPRCAGMLCLAAALVSGCSGDGTPPNPVEPVELPPDLPYVSAPAAGKLPWPHHAPSLDRAGHAALLRDLYIINNFGQYWQHGATREDATIHDGLDIVLDNGTPVYAVEAGYLRANIGGSSAYRTLVIEDADEPGMAWGYTHVNDFTVDVGGYVPQGTQIGRVRFTGLPHLHLDRLKRRSNQVSWSYWTNLLHLQPDRYFEYVDTEPPVIEAPFRFFRNGSDSAFANADPPVVGGEVDIVVGLRDPGQHARPESGEGSGDRLAVTRVEYGIDARCGATRLASFDFSRTELPADKETSETLGTYKFYADIHPGGPTSFDELVSYMTVTNWYEAVAGDDGWPVRSNRSWDTEELCPDGTPRYPNGVYEIRVWAYDARDNVASRSDTVVVRNQAPSVGR